MGAETEITYAVSRGLPGIGNILPMARSALAFVTEMQRLGDMVETWVLNDHMVVVTHPALAEQTLLRNAAIMQKDWFLRDLKRIIGEGLLSSEGDFWKRQRRLAQPAFHRERIAGYATVMVERAAAVADEWRAGEHRDVHPDFMRTTLDVVGRTLFGASVDVAHRVEPALDAIMHWYGTPFLVGNPLAMKLPLPAARAFHDAKRTLDEVILGIIEARRRKPDPDADDLLAMLLAAQDEDGSRMTDTQVRDEVMTLFLAGHETTALALSWTAWLLATHPAAQRALRDELATVLGDRDPTLEDMPRLRFTEAVVKESMRLYPPAWAIGRESTAPFELGGRRFGPRTQVWVNSYGMHRDGRYFTNPLAFTPERWMDGLDKRLPKFAYIPFGGGPRVCIGNTFAMMEAVLMLATFARRWSFAPAPDARVEARPSITLRPRYGVKLTLSRHEARPMAEAAPAE
ncbi:MAG: cytochrome P450 [Polyangiales bacterium]